MLYPQRRVHDYFALTVVNDLGDYPVDRGYPMFSINSSWCI